MILLFFLLVISTAAVTLWISRAYLAGKCSAVGKPRCREPTAFTGKVGEFKEWLFTVDEALVILQPRDQVGYAASFLEGGARQWLIATWEAEGRSMSWQQLRGQLCSAFSFQHQDEFDRQRLVHTKQTGDLEEYINMFSSRCLAATDMDDLTKTVLFTEGLLDAEVEREV